MAKYSDLLTQVRSMAGDTNVLQFSDVDIMNWLNNAVRECAIINNLLQVDASSNTVIGTFQYAVPADILKLHSIKYNTKKLRVMTLQEFDNEYEAVDFSVKGVPQVAYVWAGQIVLYPAPDSVKALKVEYIRDPPNVTDANKAVTDVPLPVGYHQRLIDYCLAQVAQQDDDMQRYQIKMQEFMTGVQSLKDQPEYTQDLYPFISVASDDMGDYGAYSSW